MAGERANRGAVLGLSAFLMIVTGVLVMSVSDAVYRGVGSPNVWHNPTQQTVHTPAAMMLAMPWLAHCWYEFARQVEAGKQRALLPWWKIVVLAVLCMGSVACKPTFMQALLPAAFVMYLVEVFRHKKEWRYFGQDRAGVFAFGGLFPAELPVLYGRGGGIHQRGGEVASRW